MKLCPRIFSISTALTFSILTSNSYAYLIDRGNGMIYDSDQNITWLQDMNYSNTTGYAAYGVMSWGEANAWADQLEFGGFSDWRLPSASLSNPETTCWAEDGSCDLGYNNTQSEFGHLFYVDLHNNADPSVGGYPQPHPVGLTNVTFVDGITGQATSFLNMNNAAYWLLESSGISELDGYGFYNQFGSQVTNYKPSGLFATAVRSGDVAVQVPEPAAIWLAVTGLLGVTFVSKRKKLGGV